jgi:ribosome modulation factor
MTAPTEREWEKAKDLGQAARRAGKSWMSCPYANADEKNRTLTDAWLNGWHDEDARRRKG